MNRLAFLALPIALTVAAMAAAPSAGRAPRPTLSADDVVVTEGGSAIVTVRLSAPQSDYVVADYRTADRRADAGLDYLESSGFLIFAPGETEKVIVIPTLDDLEVEGDEVFVVFLRGSGVRAPGGPVRVTIVDND